MTSLDDLRQQFPRFSFNIYAPAGELVTLEIIDAENDVTIFQGRSLTSCIRRAFPPVDPPAVLEPASPAPEVPGLFD